MFVFYKLLELKQGIQVMLFCSLKLFGSALVFAVISITFRLTDCDKFSAINELL